MILGIGLAMITIFMFKPSNIFAFTIGFLTSNLNFYINYSFMNKDNIKVFRAVNNFAVRIVIYAIVLTLMFKMFGQTEMLLAFCGCLSIRIAIVVQELFFKGGYK